MHVVVVGGGFGGVKTALELSKRQVGKITLISDRSYFLHHATLYATATGRSVEESVIPLNVIFAKHPNVEIIEDTIASFDPRRKLISGKRKDYHYDKLVLSMGSVTTFLGIKGLKAHAYGIQTLDEVFSFHDHVQDELIRQRLDKEYFIVGGGLTGVEMASALQSYLESLKVLYKLKGAQPKVVLVEAQSRILPRLSKTASAKVHARLKKQGIKVLLNRTVTALTDDSITIEGRLYATTTVLWASGIANNPFYKENKGYFDLTKDGRVRVNPYLEAFDDVYVIGDNNSVHKQGMAIPAFRQATHVAKNITRLATKRPQTKYRVRSVIVGVPVGDSWGYVEKYGLYLAGKAGSIVRRWMDLYGYCQILPLHVALPIWRSHSLSEIHDVERK